MDWLYNGKYLIDFTVPHGHFQYPSSKNVFRVVPFIENIGGTSTSVCTVSYVTVVCNTNHAAAQDIFLVIGW